MLSVLALLAVVTLSSVSAAPEPWFLPYAPDDNTLVLLHLDEDGGKEAGLGKLDVTASLRGDATRSEGRFGGGVSLDGTDCGVGLSNDPGLLLGYNQPFTLEAWFRPRSGAQASLFSIGTRYYLKVAPGNGSWTFGYRAASFPIRYLTISGPSISLNQWHHVALTHDETMTVRIYLDGLLVGSAQHENEGDYAKGGGAQIGSHDGWMAYFPGDIDEVRLSSIVREYAPVITPVNVLPDESIRLNLDAARVPPVVSRARIAVLDKSGQTVLSREVPRDQLDQPIMSGRDIPSGQDDHVSVKIDFIGVDDKSLSSMSVVLRNVGEQIDRVNAEADRLQKLADESAARPASAGRVEQLRVFADRLRELARERDIATADRRITAAQRIVTAVESGEAAYRARLRQVARSAQPAPDTRITMSWRGGVEGAADAFPWAERLGANEIAGYLDSAPEELSAWKMAGYKTVILGSLPVHLNNHLRDHKDQAQIGWWVTKPVKAAQATVTIPVVSPTWGGGSICPLYEPKDHWRVLDTDTEEYLDAGSWQVSEGRDLVTLAAAVPGHSYVVYFMTWAPTVGDVLLPAFQDAGLKALDEALRPFEGAVDTYWFDDLAYAYPGPTPHGVWDWEAYVYMARPEHVARFESDTGIKFDPRWLVNAPHTIEAAVPNEYLQWMYWVQPQVDAWMRKASDIPRKHGMESWLYWGDTHVGTEPFLGSLTAGGIDQVDKPSADPVTMRALTDFPGRQLRRFRIDWVFDDKAVTARFAGQLRDQWARVRRGLLMKPVTGIYWMPFRHAAQNQEAAVREDLVETIAEIDDEFRLIADKLGGQAAWTHDIDVYVLNVWGKQYSWRPWGERRLETLTDLPVRVHFLSMLELQRDGVPDDADALLCYGMPNTAQNGGHWWGDNKIVDAVKQFVEQGGGLIGMQAPSAHGQDGSEWPLADLLGIVPEGTAGYQPQKLDASFLADVGGEENRDAASSGGLLKPAKQASDHYLTLNTDAVPGFGVDVDAAPSPQGEIIYGVQTPDGTKPCVIAREYGAGRCVWLAGSSRDLAFDGLMRDIVFWASHAEKQAASMQVVEPDGVYLYAYPDVGMVAVHNSTPQSCDAALRIDAGIFANGACESLQDVVTGEQFVRTRGVFRLSMLPQCTRLLTAR